ncbi:hypothetical protein [Pseudomonas abietaniphila]|uniref:hypothetical protein n=1 Tax=Pseudomonas abietaniphila TaxID=89065 RepID=UPI0007815859|nr:hypothetical protein [Pseudomonas abietaniphila]
MELEPAPDGDLLPGLELPPLPASPPEPGSAVPFVLAPLVPLGLDDSSELEALLPDDDDGPLMLLPLELLLGVEEPAIEGAESTHVRPAIASAMPNFLFIG